MSVSSAATIALMQSIRSPSEGDVVEVAGYASLDDGGGGTFFFDTTQITDATVRSANITGATYIKYDEHEPSAIVATTAAAHLFVDGQAVLVAGVGEGADGAWWVKILDRDNANRSTRFALLGSTATGPFTAGGTAKSLIVTTSRDHRLAPGGRAIIKRVVGRDGFSLNGTWMNIGMGETQQSFTLAYAPTGSYVRGGGAVGDGGASFPSDPLDRPLAPPSPHTDGCWVRRRDGTELNVRWFGAVGNGKTDDTEALVATIRAARTFKAGVYLPAGNFRTTAEIKLETYAVDRLTDLGLSIRGEGSEQNVHNGTMITAGRAGMRSILSIHAHNVILRGLRLGCADKADHGLYLHGASTLHLDDVYVQRAVMDGYRAVRTADNGEPTNNDYMYARGLYAYACGTMYCSPSLEHRYKTVGEKLPPLPLRAVVPVKGTVSCTGKPDSDDRIFMTINGSGTRFDEIPAREGDFILIGANDATLQRHEIARIVGPEEIKVYPLSKPSPAFSEQQFAIGIGDGWSEHAWKDNNRTHLEVGQITYCAGSGIVCRGAYGPTIVNMELHGCGFAGIVIGTLDLRRAVFLGTRIAGPYFEGSFYGACIFLAQARGITIDEPMWFGQPVDRRLIYSEQSMTHGYALGYVADFVDGNHPIGLRPIGAATTDIPATRGRNFTNTGKFILPNSGALDIDSTPWTKSIPIPERNRNVQVNRETVGAPADITAEPTFLPGVDGQEVAICNIGVHPVIFHDGRRQLKTKLVLDCAPGGTVSLAPGQIMMFHYSIHNSMRDKWTQRGAVATSGN